MTKETKYTFIMELTDTQFTYLYSGLSKMEDYYLDKFYGALIKEDYENANKFDDKKQEICKLKILLTDERVFAINREEE